MDDFENKYV